MLIFNNLHGWGGLWLLIQFNIIFSHLRRFNSTHFYNSSFRIIFKLRERQFATTSYPIKLNSIRHFNLRNGEGVGPTRTLFRHPSGKRFKSSRPDPPPKCKRPEHLRLCSCRYVQTMFCVCLNAYLYNLLWFALRFMIVYPIQYYMFLSSSIQLSPL